MNYIDIIGIIILGYAAVQGFRSGFIKQLASLVGLIAGVFIAYHFSDRTYSYLLNFFDLSPKILSVLSFAITLVLVVVVVSLLGKLTDKLLDMVMLGGLNRLAGAVFGILKAGFILSVILFILNGFTSDHQFFKKETTSESFLYKPIEGFAPMIFPYLNADMVNEIQNKAKKFTKEKTEEKEVENDSTYRKTV